MDSAKVNDWMQVIGIFALVASLIFVGLQMQQDRRIAELATYQERAIASAEISFQFVSSGFFAAANSKTLWGNSLPEINVDGWAEPLDANEAIWATREVAATLFMYDNSLYQYENGFLPEEHWQRTRNTLKAFMRLPLGSWVITQILDQQRSSFRGVLIEIQSEIDAE